MTPPDDSQEAEIYVEGKRKLVEGFVRWCQKSNVGLNQIIQVKQVTEEDPTGLYDEFYIKTK
jgi:acylphosphatase